jgi:hypothetical protein
MILFFAARGSRLAARGSRLGRTLRRDRLVFVDYGLGLVTMAET